MGRILFFLMLIFSTVEAADVAGSAVTSSTAMKKTLIGVRYFSEMMGNVHQNPSRYSQVLTTISCNHPVKVMKETSKDGKEFILYGEEKWNLVTVGPYVGYVMADYLTDKKNVCFEEEYSKFFDGLNLDINDLYYWARLYDQYVQGKSKVRQ
ncbi:MAG: SH3 domain-containing protein [Bacteriovorax sp.]|nr:SH3 domain-containing protein [Bacteriovorax sp.]